MNLMALPVRLVSTWRTRFASPRTIAGTESSMIAASVEPLGLGGRAQQVDHVVDDRAAGRTSTSSTSSWPDSILEKSRIALMTLSSASPARLSVCAKTRWSGSSSVSSRSSVQPITPLIGVRISWLMLARKSDLSREASVAWSRASTIAASASASAVTSASVPTQPEGRPPSSSTGLAGEHRDAGRRAVGDDR